MEGHDRQRYKAWHRMMMITVKPAHNGQLISQTKSTVRSRWPLRETATYEIFFLDRIKKKNAR